MDEFSATTTTPSTSTTIDVTTSSSYVNTTQPFMGYPQTVYFPTHWPFTFSTTPSPTPFTSCCFPAPYFLPYNQSLQFSYTYTFPQINQSLAYPIYPISKGQGPILFAMPNSVPQDWVHREERKMSGAWTRKIARDRRKLARQRNRSFAARASIPEQTREQAVGRVESNVHETDAANRSLYTLCAPDGKRLKEIMTKKLKNSDIGYLRRIVLPKKEAELNLPALGDKEGIQIQLKDVHSDQTWSMKFKYWCNNKSRMYVLDNAGEFVKHYELQIGDSVTLYEDELKNLSIVISHQISHVYARRQYVSANKEQRPVVAEPSSGKEGKQLPDAYNCSYIHTPYKHQAEDEEEEASLALLIEELSHTEQEAANSLLSLCSDGASSSSRIPKDKTKQNLSQSSYTKSRGASSQVADQATMHGSLGIILAGEDQGDG